MERLTRPCKDTENGKYIPYTTGTYIGIFPDCTLGEVVERLAYYEDLEEQGWMIKLPCEHVYYIVDQYSEFAMVMMKSVYNLQLYEILAIDKSGRYFSTKEAAEKELKYSR